MFAVGDRVRIIKDNAHWNGAEGIVVGLDNDYVYADYDEVQGKRREHARFRRRNFELIIEEKDFVEDLV